MTFNYAWAAVLASLIPASPANGQDGKSPFAADVQATVDSSYVSRGQVENDQPVLQPAVDLSAYGIGLHAWANFNLTDRATGRRDFSEVDLTVDYTRAFGPATARAGVIQYLYPDTESPSTRELFLSISANLGVTPSLACYYDIDDVNGVYVSASLQKDIALTKRLTLTPGFSAAWADARYNAYNFRADLNAWNDGNAYALLKYALSDHLSLTGGLVYTWLWEASIRRPADRLYFDDHRLWGGVQAQWCF